MSATLAVLLITTGNTMECIAYIVPYRSYRVDYSDASSLYEPHGDANRLPLRWRIMQLRICFDQRDLDLLSVDEVKDLAVDDQMTTTTDITKGDGGKSADS